MKRSVTDWQQDQNGVVTYTLRVFAFLYENHKTESFALLDEIAVVRVTTPANPTMTQLRDAQKAALLANMRIRTQRVAESQGLELANE